MVASTLTCTPYNKLIGAGLTLAALQKQSSLLVINTNFSMPAIFDDIDWEALLLGEEKWAFLFETALRTLIMFLVIVFTLRLLGKRGVKQLSVFELGVIIGLGSAAGDPMFYKEVGILSGIVVFLTVMGLYRLITHLINSSDRFEQYMEGTATCIVEKGKLLMQNFKKEPVAMDELFSQLRLRSVSHLGQVEQAIIETSGEVSVFYYADEKVGYGLPLIPSMREHKLLSISKEGHYACTYCGQGEHLSTVANHQCSNCDHNEWLPAINDKRIA
jgi:uncharacterized membrane protein YcaP (DUF421 family)